MNSSLDNTALIEAVRDAYLKLEAELEHFQEENREVFERHNHLTFSIRKHHEFVNTLIEPGDVCPIHGTAHGDRQKQSGTKGLIVQVLEAAGVPITLQQVQSSLETAGWATKSSDVENVIRTNLNRLIKLGQVERVEDGYSLPKGF